MKYCLQISSAIIVVLILNVLYLFFQGNKVLAASYTWDGSGPDNNWSTCTNWSTDTCPTSADTVTFNSTSTKDATIDALFGGTITTLNISSGYTGTITMARSFTVTTFTQGAGTFTAANQTLDINGAFTLSAGTFTASSGSTTLAGAMTISGSPTFNHNSGTFTFDGTISAILSCNNVTFNLVTLANSAGTKTVSSNCVLPVGDAPIIGSGGGSLALNGGLIGSGTLTVIGSLTLGSTGSLSGFNGLSIGVSIAINGGTWDFSNYSVWTEGSQYTQTGGVVTMPTVMSGTIFFFNFAMTASSGGVFNAPPSLEMFVHGNFSIGSGNTFNANNGTVRFSSSAGTSSRTISCGNATFYRVLITHLVNTRTINADCNLPLGDNPTIGNGGSISLNGTLTGTGVLTATAGTLTLNAGSSLSGFTGVSLNALTVNGATVNFSTHNPVDINNTFTLLSGTYTAPSNTMTVAGGLVISGGSFDHNNGTIVLDGLNQTVSGSFTFYNLTKNISSASTITFAASSTQTILGTLRLKGTTGNILAMISSASGTQWNIDPRGNRDIEYVDVRDSNNINATAISVTTGSYDSGNNSGWNITNIGSSDALSTGTGVRDSAADSAWWNYSWSFRKELVFNNTSSNLGVSSETLSDFPILVKLTSSNFEFDKAKSDGSDLRFIDADNKTSLSFEIEKWNQSEREGLIWVKVPQIDNNSNSDKIYMYYGNRSASDAQNVTNTWNSGYVGVWHMKESGVTIFDSTLNGNNGNKTSATQPVKTSSGQIDGAQSFDGINDYINVSDPTNGSLDFGTGNFTFSAWFSRNSTATSDYILGKRGTTSHGNFYSLSCEASKTVTLEIDQDNAATNYQAFQVPDACPIGGWHKLSAVRTDSQLKLYLDGSEIASTPSLNATLDNPWNLYLGARGSGSQVPFGHFDGNLDEIRMSNKVRSPAWIAAEYKNGVDQFINYSSQSVTPAGQTISLGGNISSGKNGNTRINGTIKSGNESFIITSVECSVNGADYQGAIATDGEFNELEEEFFYDFKPAENNWTGDGFAIVCRGVRTGGAVIENYLYFTPFSLNSPKDKAYLTDTNPSFSFSVNKQHNILKNTLLKYQIQVRRPTGGSWSTYIDDIPVDREDGSFQTDKVKGIISDKSSSIQIQSKVASLSGSYVWKVVAVDKSGHSFEAGPRSLTVMSKQVNDSDFPLAILNISGYGKTNISTTYLRDMKQEYITTLTSPEFYGIANVGAEVTLYLADVSCSVKQSTDCAQIYKTHANDESRYGINIPNGQLISGKTYTAIMTAQSGDKYTELPTFNLIIGNYKTSFQQPTYINPTIFISPVPISETISPVKQKKIDDTSERSIVEKKFCIFSFCL